MDARTLKHNFGRRIRSLRLLRALTQERLSELAGLSPEYVSKIERGQASPSFGSIAELARALEVKPHQLFDFKDLSNQ